MTAPQDSPGEVLLIPKTYPHPTHVESVVEKYKAVRLHALKDDPQSFSSTYEDEAQFSYETWLSRVLNPLGKTFVALNEPRSRHEHEVTASALTDGDEQGAFSRLLNHEWVGIVTLLGPLRLPSELESEQPEMKPWDVFISHGKAGLLSTAPKPGNLKGAHVVYLIVGMYVVPDARRQGHARRLVNASIKAAHDEAIAFDASKVSVSVHVEPNNSSAQRLYETAGFEVWDENVEIANRQGDISRIVSLVTELDLKPFH